MAETCRFCGAPLEKGAAFCRECGKPIAPPKEKPVQPQVKKAEPVSKEPAPKKKKSKLTLLLFLVDLALLIWIVRSYLSS